MGKKSAPKPPDPAETAAAQTGTNVSTAVANAYLNNVGQVTPNASLSYEQTGQHAWTDPSTDTTYQIPTFTAYQQLSPEQEAIQTAGNQASLNLANLAAGQSARVQDLLGQPISFEGVPDRPGTPGYYGYSNFQGFDGLETRDAEGGDLTRTYGANDFSHDRGRVEKALMDRLQPYLDRDRSRMQSDLANQGLMLGSEGHMRGMDDFGRQANDARLAAILSAGQEQSRMVGMDRDRAMFQNMAQSQAFGQDRTNLDARNAALQQMFGNYMQSTAANNQLQDARFNQDVARHGMQTDARNAALQEAYAMRNQPINEIAALMSGGQVSAPNFVNTGQYTIPTTDYAGIVGNNYNQQMMQHQSNQQFGGNLMGGLFGLGAGYLAGM